MDIKQFGCFEVKILLTTETPVPSWYREMELELVSVHQLTHLKEMCTLNMAVRTMSSYSQRKVHQFIHFEDHLLVKLPYLQSLTLLLCYWGSLAPGTREHSMSSGQWCVHQWCCPCGAEEQGGEGGRVRGWKSEREWNGGRVNGERVGGWKSEGGVGRGWERVRGGGEGRGWKGERVKEWEEGERREWEGEWWRVGGGMVREGELADGWMVRGQGC